MGGIGRTLLLLKRQHQRGRHHDLLHQILGLHRPLGLKAIKAAFGFILRANMAEGLGLLEGYAKLWELFGKSLA